MSVSLISLEEAKAQVRVVHDEEDTDLLRKIDLAQAQVLIYLEAESNITGSPVTWDSQTAPGDVKAAILAQTAWLWQFRGDAEAPALGPNGMLSPLAEAHLKMRRPPALA